MNQEIIELLYKLDWYVKGAIAYKRGYEVALSSLDCIGDVLSINDAIINGLTHN